MNQFETKPNEIITTSETTEVTLENQKELDSILVECFGQYKSLNWDRTLEKLETLELSEEQKDQVRQSIMSYIQITFRTGAFSNLRGVDKILAYFDFENIGFSGEYIEKVITLYGKYSLDFLYRMSPSLYDGKLIGGKEYDEVEYTRGLLKESGAGEEELTEEYIKDLWNMREVLLQIHSKFKGKELTLEGLKLTDLTNLLSN